jgi:hypothetical protein
MTYTDDSHLPEISDETLTAVRDSAQPYTLVILKAGPRFAPPGPDRNAEVDRIIWQHGKRNLALRTAGLMPIICPIADGSGVCGVAILDATPDDAERIMALDPGVQAGVFSYEIHPTRSFPGSSLPGASHADTLGGDGVLPGERLDSRGATRG